jgi:hypothetical protein
VEIAAIVNSNGGDGVKSTARLLRGLLSRQAMVDAGKLSGLFTPAKNNNVQPAFAQQIVAT